MALTCMVQCAELEAMRAGDRLMDINAQGQDVLTSFDVYGEAGKLCTAYEGSRPGTLSTFQA